MLFAFSNYAGYCMRKILTLLSILVLLGGTSYATNPDVGRNRANARVNQYIDGVYAQLKYKRGMKRLKLETFRRAYYGYLNLLEHGSVSNRKYLTICDFSLSSNTNRLWLIDTRTKKVVFNTLVAHGVKTGDEYAKYFSNVSESHQSSLGFYITKNSYAGHNGYSMRMEGVDGRFNNNAMKRDVVMHGAAYVSKSFARANRRIGRSWGCPSVALNMAAPIIDRIKNGSVLFIYHPTKSYLRASYWLNNRVGRLPSEADRVLANTTNDPVDASKTTATDTDQKEVKIQMAKSMLAEQEEMPIEDDAKLTTITKLEEPQEIKDLEKQEGVKIKTIIIPADEVTPEMRNKALKKKKIVRKVSKITHLNGKTDKEVLK